MPAAGQHPCPDTQVVGHRLGRGPSGQRWSSTWAGGLRERCSVVAAMRRGGCEHRDLNWCPCGMLALQAGSLTYTAPPIHTPFITHMSLLVLDHCFPPQSLKHNERQSEIFHLRFILQSQVSTTPYGSPLWVAGTQVPEPSSAASQGVREQKPGRKAEELGREE